MHSCSCPLESLVPAAAAVSAFRIILSVCDRLHAYVDTYVARLLSCHSAGDPVSPHSPAVMNGRVLGIIMDASRTYLYITYDLYIRHNGQEEGSAFPTNRTCRFGQLGLIPSRETQTVITLSHGKAGKLSHRVGQ